MEEVRRAQVSSYGIIEPKKLEEGVYDVVSVVEKPSPESAPSNLGIVGRYVLPPQIFEALEHTPRRVPAESSSSPTPSPCCSSSNESAQPPFRAPATTQAALWGCFRRRWP